MGASKPAVGKPHARNKALFSWRLWQVGRLGPSVRPERNVQGGAMGLVWHRRTVATWKAAIYNSEVTKVEEVEDEETRKPESSLQTNSIGALATVARNSPSPVTMGFSRGWDASLLTLTHANSKSIT
jgi:hypothetical protein